MQTIKNNVKSLVRGTQPLRWLRATQPGPWICFLHLRVLKFLNEVKLSNTLMARHTEASEIECKHYQATCGTEALDK